MIRKWFLNFLNSLFNFAEIPCENCSKKDSCRMKSLDCENYEEEVE